MPIAPADERFTFSLNGLYLPDTIARGGPVRLLGTDAPLLGENTEALAVAFGLRTLTEPRLNLTSSWDPAWSIERWWRTEGCDAEDCGYRAASVTAQNTLEGANAEIKQQWRQRATEAHELAHRLAGFGLTTAAQEARNSGQNFQLVGSLIENIETQPFYVYDAFHGHGGILATVYSIAETGYTYLRAYARLRQADRARRRRRDVAAVLAQALSRARENLEALIARRHANEQTVRDADPPDAPHRAMPRETRAGPAREEPSEPAHEPDGCKRGEAYATRPATDRSHLSTTRHQPSAEPHCQTQHATHAGAHV